MVFKSDRQRKAVMAKLNQGSVRSDVNPTIKDITGRKLKIRIKKKDNRFVVKDSQNRTIAVGKTKPSAIKRARWILTGFSKGFKR